jgi:hypothetical protein
VTLFTRILRHVQQLVNVYETVKKDEQERRAMYKNEKNKFDEEIHQLEIRLQSSLNANTDDKNKMEQIDEQYQLVANRLQNQRLILVRQMSICFSTEHHRY